MTCLYLFVYLTLNFDLFAEFAVEPQALSERSHRKACDGEAEVGDGVQGVPGVGGRLHEHAGKSQYNRLLMNALVIDAFDHTISLAVTTFHRGPTCTISSVIEIPTHI